MKPLQINTNPKVKTKFKNYPAHARKRVQKLRDLIIQSAREVEDIDEIEETLKWGEPSYLVDKGSTVRIDWKEKNPDQYAIYFKCTSKLVPTFRKIYKNQFEFEKNRAIVFEMDEKIPESELKNCIKAALTYHKVKQLPDLGIK